MERKKLMVARYVIIDKTLYRMTYRDFKRLVLDRTKSVYLSPCTYNAIKITEEVFNITEFLEENYKVLYNSIRERYDSIGG